MEHQISALIEWEGFLGGEFCGTEIIRELWLAARLLFGVVSTEERASRDERDSQRFFPLGCSGGLFSCETYMHQFLSSGMEDGNPAFQT